jgi:hypothetical protein
LGAKNSLKKEYSLITPAIRQNEEKNIITTIKTLWQTGMTVIKDTISTLCDVPTANTLFLRNVQKRPHYSKKRWQKLLKTFKYKRGASISTL